MSSPIGLLQEQIQRAEALMGLPNNSPQYKIWCDTTARILRDNFTSEYVEMFNAFIKRLDEQVQLLHAIIAEHNRFHDDPAVDISRSAPFQTYDFHREVKAVSLRLYENKHYAQAIEEAFKRVIQEVKRIYQERTGQVLDGEPLMNRAFGCTNQTPVITFNPLQSPEDRDEQQGMMNLFKGIVGIRNKKAHTNVILDDPVRAIEYLCLASLLMRLLDQFAV